jgi:hypothetical protein
MHNDDNDDVIESFIALGVIVFAGIGLYKIVSSFGSLENGDKVTKEELIESINEQSDLAGDEEIDNRIIIERIKNGPIDVYTRYKNDICDICGTVSPERCKNGHCMNCVGEETSGDGKCYNGCCLCCHGWAGGNECNVCSSDD